MHDTIHVCHTIHVFHTIHGYHMTRVYHMSSSACALAREAVTHTHGTNTGRHALLLRDTLTSPATRAILH